jgi:hypothetical protein
MPNLNRAESGVGTVIDELIDQATAALRETTNRHQIALAVAKTGYLLGALQAASCRIGTPVPVQIPSAAAACSPWFLAMHGSQPMQRRHRPAADPMEEGHRPPPIRAMDE